MPFRKVDVVKEQEEMCKKDKEFAKYTEEFNKEYEDRKYEILNEKHFCDVCETEMTKQDYHKNNGFCEECGRDICE